MKLIAAAITAAVSVLCTSAGFAQKAQPVTPAVSAASAQQPEARCVEEDPKRKAAIERALNDWPNLARYRDANMKLAPVAPGVDRVVFMGDSITDNWTVTNVPWLPGMKGFFPGKPYVGRGISGQTTPQMLVRFRQDVVNLHPKVVVILGGINDIAGNTGEIPLSATEDNIASMAEIARANGIRVILASVLPASKLPWRPSVTDVPQKVTTLNQWIREYAARNKFVYLDYYSAMVDQNGGLKSEYAHDAVHPNAKGYEAMAPLAEAAIKRALKQKTASR